MVLADGYGRDRLPYPFSYVTDLVQRADIEPAECDPQDPVATGITAVTLFLTDEQLLRLTSALQAGLDLLYPAVWQDLMTLWDNALCNANQPNHSGYILCSETDTMTIIQRDCILYSVDPDGTENVLLDVRACARELVQNTVIDGFDDDAPQNFNPDIAPAWDEFEPVDVSGEDLQDLCGASLKAMEFLERETGRFIDILADAGSNVDQFLRSATNIPENFITTKTRERAASAIGIFTSITAAGLRSNLNQTWRDEVLCAFYQVASERGTIDTLSLDEVFSNASARLPLNGAMAFLRVLVQPVVPGIETFANASIIDRRQIVNQFIRGLDEPNDDCSICTPLATTVAEEIFRQAIQSNPVPRSDTLNLVAGNYDDVANILWGSPGSGNRIDAYIQFAQPAFVTAWLVRFEHTQNTGVNYDAFVDIVEPDGNLIRVLDQRNEPADRQWSGTLSTPTQAVALRVVMRVDPTSATRAVRVERVRVVTENFVAGIKEP